MFSVLIYLLVCVFLCLGYTLTFKSFFNTVQGYMFRWFARYIYYLN